MNRISFPFRTILPYVLGAGSGSNDDDNNDRSVKAKLNKQNVNKRKLAHTHTQDHRQFQLASNTKVMNNKRHERRANKK